MEETGAEGHGARGGSMTRAVLSKVYSRFDRILLSDGHAPRSRMAAMNGYRMSLSGKLDSLPLPSVGRSENASRIQDGADER